MLHVKIIFCDDNHLVLNANKTKEIVFDPQGIGDHRPVVILNLTIAQVNSYRYLGVFIDNTPTWSTHVDRLCSRLQHRLCFLYPLRAHGVDKKITLIFYQAVLDSLIRYGITARFGISAQLRNKLLRLTHTTWKILGVREHSSMQRVYEQALLCQANKIINDPSHVLQAEHEPLPSGRRFRVPQCRLSKTQRFKNSFVKLVNGGR